MNRFAYSKKQDTKARASRRRLLPGATAGLLATIGISEARADWLMEPQVTSPPITADRIYTREIEASPSSFEIPVRRGRACAFAIDAADPDNIITGQVLPDGNVVFSLANKKQTAMVTLRERGTLAAEVAAEVKNFCFNTDGA